MFCHILPMRNRSFCSSLHQEEIWNKASPQPSLTDAGSRGVVHRENLLV